MKTYTKLFTTILLSSMLLTACDGANTETNNTQPTVNNSDDQSPSNNSISNNIKNTQWKLISAITPAQELPNELYFHKEKAKLSFSDTNNQPTASFNVGCNLMQGTYNLDNNVLTTTAIASTKKYCGELDKSEKLLAQILSQKVAMNITKKGNSTLLIMTAEDGKVLRWLQQSSHTQVQNQLKKYKWQLTGSSNQLLTEYINAPVSSAVPSSVGMNLGQLRFDNSLDNKLTYSMGCNDFRGSYNLDKELTLKTTAMMVTKKSCMNLMDYENELNKIMNKTSTISYSNNKDTSQILKQTFNDDANTTITWQGSYKRFNAQVSGKLTKRNSQGKEELIKQQSTTVKNVFLPHKDDCSSFVDTGLMHMALSNYQQKSCVYHGDNTATYTVYVPDTKETYHYGIKLAEKND